jgi:DNA repair protein RAD50
VQAELSSFDSAVQKISQFEEQQKMKALYRNAEASYTEAKAKLDEIIKAAQELIKQKKSVEADLAVQRPLAESASEEIKELEARKNVIAAQASIKAKLSQINKSLQGLSEFDRDSLDPLKEEYNKVLSNLSKYEQQLSGQLQMPQLEEDKRLQSELDEATSSLKHLRISPNIAVLENNLLRYEEEAKLFAAGECPTCHQAISPDSLNDNANSIKAVKAEIAQLNKEYEEAKIVLSNKCKELTRSVQDRKALARTVLEKLKAKETDKFATVKKQLSDLEAAIKTYDGLHSQRQALLQQVVEVADVDDEAIKSLKAVVEKYTALDSLYRSVSTDVKIKQSSYESAKAAVDKADKLKSSIMLGSDTFSDEEIEEAKKALEIVSTKTQLKKELIDSIGMLEARLNSYRSTVDETTQKIEAEKTVKKWATLCEKTRQVLHVNGLPTLMMREYASRLNVRIQHYLQVWEAPFKVYLDDALNFIAEFRDGTKMLAARLSGGQKIVASTSFRLAMSDTFARNVGLLVLDEPTNHLDKDNIIHLQQLLVKLKSLSGSTGRQIIIVTHEESLTGFFDHTIRLS